MGPADQVARLQGVLALHASSMRGMGLTLYVDGDRWRAHLTATLASHPGLVPVVKGNGYGFGICRLARKAGWLGVDTLAVGTYQEAAEVAPRFGGSILVLTPWRPSDPAAVFSDRVMHTVGRLDDLERLGARADRAAPGRRVVPRCASLGR